MPSDHIQDLVVPGHSPLHQSAKEVIEDVLPPAVASYRRLVGRVVLEEFLAVTAERDIALAPGFTWECVNHLQEYGPERLDVVVR